MKGTQQSWGCLIVVGWPSKSACIIANYLVIISPGRTCVYVVAVSRIRWQAHNECYSPVDIGNFLSSMTFIQPQFGERRNHGNAHNNVPCGRYGRLRSR